MNKVIPKGLEVLELVSQLQGLPKYENFEPDISYDYNTREYIITDDYTGKEVFRGTKASLDKWVNNKLTLNTSDSLNSEDILRDFIDAYFFEDGTNFFMYVDGKGIEHRLYPTDEEVRYVAYKDNKKINDFSFPYTNDLELQKGLNKIKELVDTSSKETKLSKVLKKLNLQVSSKEDIKIKAYNGNGIPESLSNFVFGLSEFLRQEKFPFLENIGTADQIEAIRYVLEEAVRNNEDPAEALNNSKLGFTNWETVEDTGNFMQLVSEDRLGNVHYIEIRIEP